MIVKRTVEAQMTVVMKQLSSRALTVDVSQESSRNTVEWLYIYFDC